MTVGTGRELGSANATSMSKYIPFNYIATVVTEAFFVAPIACRVTAIQGRPRVAGNDGSAVTFTFYKSASGVAAASGTLLHSGTYDLKGTADTNQSLTLVSNVDSLTLNAGDAISAVLTGTATAAIGTITVTVEPVA